jgi:excisionase family DNA binding protein
MSTQLWTVAEAAERLHISANALRGFIAGGELRFVDVGSPRRPRLRIRDEDLTELIEARTRKAS